MSPDLDINRRSTIRVWDPLVRTFHWTVALACLGAYLTTDDWRRLHEVLGYWVLGAVIVRVVWGFVGTRHAQFADFVKGPRRLGRYMLGLAQGTEPRYVGHNPLGGLMVLALLLVLGGLGVTGWMMGLDAFWGDELLGDLHADLANLLLVLVGLHLLGVVWESLRHGENLVAAMITGRKPASPSSSGPEEAPRHGLPTSGRS
jgi:cytochrome b